MWKQGAEQNAVSSVAQVVVGSVALFILYKYLLAVIGPALLGVWSLVLAASSMVQVANLGLTGSIVKHVANYNAGAEERAIALVVETAAITIAAMGIVLTVFAYFGAHYSFAFLLDEKSRDAAEEILPLGLLSFWLFLVSSIYQSGLYGCQLIGPRNAVLIGESLSYLVLCMILAPQHGLIGLALARAIQNCLTLIAMMAILRKHVPSLHIVPQRWSKQKLSEIFGYAASFQIITFLALLCDPITKGLLSWFGSTSSVGYYEMANKLVLQFRALLVNANQVLVPVFATLMRIDPDKTLSVYLRSYEIVFFIALPVFVLLAVSSPLISELWIGYFEPTFVWSMILLCGGWLINTLATPAYFSDMGTGDMKRNLLSHAVMVAINIAFGIVLGNIFGGNGVVVAWFCALFVAGVLLNYLFFLDKGIAYRQLIPQSNRDLVFFTLFGVLVGYLVYFVMTNYGYAVIPTTGLSEESMRVLAGTVMLALYLAAVGWGVRQHPISCELILRVTTSLRGRLNV